MKIWKKGIFIINKLEIASHISNNCSDLFKNMLIADYNKRIKLNNVFKHPWIQSFQLKYKNVDNIKFQLFEKDIFLNFYH